MQKYNIAALVKRTGRRSANVLLPPISERLNTQKAYLAAMRVLLAGLRAEIISDVLPKYQTQVRLIRDADGQSFDRLRRIAEYLVGIAQGTVNRILGLEAQKHTEKFVDVARKALGIDISAIVTQEDLGAYLEVMARRNADLIKSQAETMIRRIEQATLQNTLAGNPRSVLQKQFIEEFGIADRKAKLLARDQSSKLTSDLNRIRQEQAGIEEYRWMTVKDERVRELHQRIDGTDYKWGERTGAEGGLPPGQPIQCRCIARGKVVFGEAEAVKPKPVVNTAALDTEMKGYVLGNGKRDGVEYLAGYDRVTGELADRSSGTKGHVGFTPAFEAAINDPKNQIVAHHNHPSSNSFSGQDILELNRRPGLVGLWAHGHNGSSYYAEPGKHTDAARILAEMDRATNEVRAFLQDKVNNRVVTVEDAGKTQWHSVLLLAEKRGVVTKYNADLKSDNKSAFERHRDSILKFIEGLGE